MTITTGDCVEVMAGMAPDSIDAICTDPPYGLEFMGKEWDRYRLDDTGTKRNRGERAASPDIGKDSSAEPRAKDNPWQKEASGYRAGDRAMTYRCVGCGKRDQWQNEHGCEAKWKREVVDPYAAPPSMLAYSEWCRGWALEAYRVAKPGAYLLAFGGTRTVHRLTVALEDAGWIIRDLLVWAYASGFPKSKASLKPAWEPIVLARKPGPLQELAIDACRIGTDETMSYSDSPAMGSTPFATGGTEQHPAGRWPANVLLTDPVFDGGWDGVVGGGETSSVGRNPGEVIRKERESYRIGSVGPVRQMDTGTYSRFFLVPKASRSDREPLVPGDLEPVVVKTQGRAEGRSVQPDGSIVTHGDTRKPRVNTHPTVKSTNLMRHLVRLVTPQGGTVLDPFLGSGSTALAATMEGFPWVGIEREADYVRIAEQRLERVQQGLGLDVPAPDTKVSNRDGVAGPRSGGWQDWMDER